MTQDDDAVFAGVVRGMWKLIGLVAAAALVVVAVLVLR